MSKRRKRRRLAFINRMNEIIKENPTLSIDKAKTRTAIEVKSALRHADKTAPHSREEHNKVFEDTLFGRNKITTTTKPTTTTTKAKPKTSTTTTKAKPKTTTTTRAKKSTTATTKKRTTTKRTKKAK